MNDNEKTARALLWRADSLLTGPDGALLWATLEGLLDDLTAALERAERAEQERDDAHHHIQLHLDALPPDIMEERRRCAGARLAAAKAREDRDAALERERMALWALALERLEGLPEGWRASGPMARHASGGRLLRRWSDGGCTAAAGDGQMQRHPTVHAAILSIDPTAKPPPGWTP